jgi:hypothetical protein
MAKQLKTEIGIPLENLENVIESAISQVTYGMGYWGSTHPSVSSAKGALTTRGIVINEIDDSTGKVIKTYRLNRQAVERGVALFAKLAPARFGELLEDCGGDGTTGDLLIQFALFGEERYA